MLKQMELRKEMLATRLQTSTPAMKLERFWPYIMQCGRGKRFSLSPNDRIGFGSHQVPYWRVAVVPWPEGKRPVLEADGLLPRSTMVKNEWSLTSSLHLRFHGVHRDSCAKW